MFLHEINVYVVPQLHGCFSCHLSLLLSHSFPLNFVMILNVKNTALRKLRTVTIKLEI